MKRGRRRFLRILAAMPGLAVASRHGLAQDGRALGLQDLHSWRGVALGADARIQVAHGEAAEGLEILRQCQVEIETIEALFSLHRGDSTISRLNAEGIVTNVPESFLDLLRVSKHLHAATSGYFDPSVQPLWQVYAATVKPDSADEKNLRDKILECQGRIGLHHVEVTADSAILRKSGMALTMNGIAQGYLTDRIVALLRAGGIRTALVETGETYGLGNHPTERKWRLGVPDPKAPTQVTRVVSLEDRAVATSAPSGTVFDRAGRFHHLFNPHTGRCASQYSSVTVAAPSAAVADALSTAFSAMPRNLVLDTVKALPGVGIHMVGTDGTITESGAI